MSALMLAIPAVEHRTGRAVILIGGLAVLCRRTTPHRSTVDLDTVDRRRGAEPGQLELLLASGAAPSGVSGVFVPTAAGDVQVDVLEVTDADLSPLPEDPTDRLHVLAHAWAAAATPVRIRAYGLAEVVVPVAEPGPLVAMKMQSVMNRGSAKEGTDLLDIMRLGLDPRVGPRSRGQLFTADVQLREDARRHADKWFNTGAQRSLRLLRMVPEGRGTVLDDVRLVGDLLATALGAPTA